jgi:hypothetical protein
MRRIWLTLLVTLWFTACHPIQHPLFLIQPSVTPPPYPPLTCEQILGVEVRSLRGELAEQDQLFGWIEEAFRVDRTQMEVLDLNQPPNPLNKWFVTWSKAGITYQITVSEGTVYGVRIIYPQEAVTIEKVIDCIGEIPEYYFAQYSLVRPAEIRPYYQSVFFMLFPERGIFAAVPHETNPQPFTPQVNEGRSVSDIVYTNPGSPSEVFNRSFGFPDNRRVTPQPQPWPGGWDEIKFIDTTAE